MANRRPLPDGYERLVFFTRAGHRVDVTGTLGVSTALPVSEADRYPSAGGGEFSRSKRWRAEVSLTDGTLVDVVSELSRLSNRWQFVGLGIGRHVQFYESAPMLTASDREGPGGWAAESASLAYGGVDPEVEESDNLLALLGWRDLRVMPDAADIPDGAGRLLRTRYGGEVVATGRSLAWTHSVAPTVLPAAGRLDFPAAFTLASPLLPFPCPGARLRLVQPDGLVPTLDYFDVAGVPLEPGLELSGVAGGTGYVESTAPPSAFYVRASLVSPGAGSVGPLFLSVVSAGASVAAFTLSGEVAPAPPPDPPPPTCVAPAIPDGRIGARTNTTATFTWDAVPGAAGYFLRYDTDEAGPFAGLVITDVPTATVEAPGLSPVYARVAAFYAL